MAHSFHWKTITDRKRFLRRDRNRALAGEFLMKREGIRMGTLLIVILLLLLLGAWPAWPYSRGWGYYPSGGLGLVLVVVLVLALMGRI
jgi:hypothetical protein